MGGGSWTEGGPEQQHIRDLDGGGGDLILPHRKVSKSKDDPSNRRGSLLEDLAGPRTSGGHKDANGTAGMGDLLAATVAMEKQVRSQDSQHDMLRSKSTLDADDDGPPSSEDDGLRHLRCSASVKLAVIAMSVAFVAATATASLVLSEENRDAAMTATRDTCDAGLRSCFDTGRTSTEDLAAQLMGQVQAYVALEVENFVSGPGAYVETMQAFINTIPHELLTGWGPQQFTFLQTRLRALLVSLYDAAERRGATELGIVRRPPALPECIDWYGLYPNLPPCSSLVGREENLCSGGEDTGGTLAQYSREQATNVWVTACPKSCNRCPNTTKPCADRLQYHVLCVASNNLFCSCSTILAMYPCGSFPVIGGYQIDVSDVCRQSCGLCDGVTPVRSAMMPMDLDLVLVYSGKYGNRSMEELWPSFYYMGGTDSEKVRGLSMVFGESAASGDWLYPSKPCNLFGSNGTGPCFWANWAPPMTRQAMCACAECFMDSFNPNTTVVCNDSDHTSADPPLAGFGWLPPTKGMVEWSPILPARSDGGGLLSLFSYAVWGNEDEPWHPLWGHNLGIIWVTLDALTMSKMLRNVSDSLPSEHDRLYLVQTHHWMMTGVTVIAGASHNAPYTDRQGMTTLGVETQGRQRWMARPHDMRDPVIRSNALYVSRLPGGLLGAVGNSSTVRTWVTPDDIADMANPGFLFHGEGKCMVSKHSSDNGVSAASAADAPEPYTAARTLAECQQACMDDPRCSAMQIRILNDSSYDSCLLYFQPGIDRTDAYPPILGFSTGFDENAAHTVCYAKHAGEVNGRRFSIAAPEMVCVNDAQRAMTEETGESLTRPDGWPSEEDLGGAYYRVEMIRYWIGSLPKIVQNISLTSCAEHVNNDRKCGNAFIYDSVTADCTCIKRERRCEVQRSVPDASTTSHVYTFDGECVLSRHPVLPSVQFGDTNEDNNSCVGRNGTAPPGDEFWWNVIEISDRHSTSLRLNAVLLVERKGVMGVIDDTRERLGNDIQEQNRQTDATIEEQLYQTVIILTIVLTLLTMLAIYLPYRIVAPLELLERDMREVAFMRLDALAEQQPTPFKEIRNMQISFTRMTRNLKEFRAYLPAHILHSQHDSDGDGSGFSGIDHEAMLENMSDPGITSQVEMISQANTSISRQNRFDHSGLPSNVNSPEDGSPGMGSPENLKPFACSSLPAVSEVMETLDLGAKDGVVSGMTPNDSSFCKGSQPSCSPPMANPLTIPGRDGSRQLSVTAGGPATQSPGAGGAGGGAVAAAGAGGGEPGGGGASQAARSITTTSTGTARAPGALHGGGSSGSAQLRTVGSQQTGIDRSRVTDAASSGGGRAMQTRGGRAADDQLLRPRDEDISPVSSKGDSEAGRPAGQDRAEKKGSGGRRVAAGGKAWKNTSLGIGLTRRRVVVQVAVSLKDFTGVVPEKTYGNQQAQHADLRHIIEFHTLWLEAVISDAQKHRGNVERFVVDQIDINFGATQVYPCTGQKAGAWLLEMRSKVEKIRVPSCFRDRATDLLTYAGAAQGSVFYGNLGCATSRSIAIVGRIVGQARVYQAVARALGHPVDFIIDSKMSSECQGTIMSIPVDTIEIKDIHGKERRIELFHPLSAPQDPSRRSSEWMYEMQEKSAAAPYDKAWEMARRGNVADAARALRDFAQMAVDAVQSSAAAHNTADPLTGPLASAVRQQQVVADCVAARMSRYADDVRKVTGSGPAAGEPYCHVVRLQDVVPRIVRDRRGSHSLDSSSNPVRVMTPVRLTAPLSIARNTSSLSLPVAGRRASYALAQTALPPRPDAGRVDALKSANSSAVGADLRRSDTHGSQTSAVPPNVAPGGGRAPAEADVKADVKLLYQLKLMLPPDVLPRLEARLRAADHINFVDEYRSGSVIFADIAGFTAHAARTSQRQVVQMLIEVFNAFDALAADDLSRDGSRVTKIKTIGDGYMAATGIPVEDPRHADAALSFSLDLLGVLDAYNRDKGESLALRVGINSGPVTGGIIGRRQFCFDIWGDTVNVASRMESTGAPGAVQLTEQTYNLLTFDAKKQLSECVKGQQADALFPDSPTSPDSRSSASVRSRDSRGDSRSGRSSLGTPRRQSGVWQHTDVKGKGQMRALRVVPGDDVLGHERFKQYVKQTIQVLSVAQEQELIMEKLGL